MIFVFSLLSIETTKKLRSHNNNNNNIRAGIPLCYCVRYRYKTRQVCECGRGKIFKKILYYGNVLCATFVVILSQGRLREE